MSIVYIVSAPSGSGKSTLVNELFKMVRNLDFSISYTTRPPRGSEQNGKEYFFVSKPEFEAMIAADEFLEYARLEGDGDQNRTEPVDVGQVVRELLTHFSRDAEGKGLYLRAMQHHTGFQLLKNMIVIRGGAVLGDHLDGRLVRFFLWLGHNLLS